MEKSARKKLDYTLLFLVLFLVCFGLVTLYSTSAYNGQVKFGDAAYYFKKQFFATSLGVAAMYVISCMDYHVFMKLAIPGYFVSLALSGLVLLVGDSYNGSKRWISLGPLSFQPSEFAKLAVILFLACMVSRQKQKRNSILNLFLVLGMVLPIVGLVGTNNLSTAIIILGHCGDPGICIQSQICAVPLDGGDRSGIYRNLFEPGILPPGTPCHLEGP